MEYERKGRLCLGAGLVGLTATLVWVHYSDKQREAQAQETTEVTLSNGIEITGRVERKAITVVYTEIREGERGNKEKLTLYDLGDNRFYAITEKGKVARPFTNHGKHQHFIGDSIEDILNCQKD